MENNEKFKIRMKNQETPPKLHLCMIYCCPNSGGAVMSKTILIIEDEISIQNIVRAFLEDAGYTVFCAGDGLEGIEIFRNCYNSS